MSFPLTLVKPRAFGVAGLEPHFTSLHAAHMANVLNDVPHSSASLAAACLAALASVAYAVESYGDDQ